ncbi:ABC transporter permease [Streptomyces sp. NPDC059002]|uniref:ABC transporter permease n=1 Tax=Streptomyces sp. NPDC059002 TaxID=3346690 RepID=UPI0036B0F381
MLRLAVTGIRQHRYGFVGALCAAAMAAMLIAACGILVESGLRAVPQADRFGATSAVVRLDPDVVIRTGSGQNVDNESYPLDQPPRLSAAQVAKVRQVPGVDRVVTDTPFYAQAIAADGTAQAAPDDGVTEGHAWDAAALTPFTLASGKAPAAPDEVVLDAGTAQRGGHKVGGKVRVVTADGAATYRVSGIARPGGRAELPDQSSLFFTSATAERLSGADGQAAFAGVFTKGGSVGAVEQRVREALDVPHLDVLTGDARAKAGAPGTTEQLASTTLLFGPMAGIGGFLAVFVLGGTIALGVLQRTQEIALLRAVGATSWQVRRMVAAETLLASLAGLLPGFLLSVPLSAVILDRLHDRGTAPDAYELVVGPLPFLLAGGATLLLALLAALAAAGRISRIRPADALQEAVSPRRPVTVTRVVLALFPLGGGIALFFATQHIGGEVGVAFQYLIVLLLMGAAALLGPLLARILEPPLGALVSAIGGVTGWLAHANSRFSVRRVASMASALMLTVAMACTVLLVTGSMNRITAEQTDRRTQADLVLLPQDSPGLPADVAEAARGLDGAAAVAATRSTTVISDVLGTPDVLGAQALDPAAAGKVMDLGLREGSLKSLERDGTAAVSRTYAKQRGFDIGDRFDAWLGDGTKVKLTVGAVFDRPLGLGDILLSERYLGPHLHENLDDSVLVRAAPGQGDRLRAAAAALVKDHPTVEVTDVDEYAHGLRTSLAQNTTGTYLVLSVLVLFTAVSMINGLLMGTAERAKEVSLLRLLGAGPRHITGMLYLETLIAVLIGAATGTAIAVTGLAGANGALTGSTDFSIPPVGYSLILAGVAALALISTALPAALALRNRPDGVLPSV